MTYARKLKIASLAHSTQLSQN